MSGASRHYNSYLLKGITLRRQRFAKGLAWKWQEIASGFLGDFSGTQGLTQGSARDNEGMPSVCQGIDQAVARALWLSPSGCSVANLFFFMVQFRILHTFIRDIQFDLHKFFLRV